MIAPMCTPGPLSPALSASFGFAPVSVLLPIDAPFQFLGIESIDIGRRQANRKILSRGRCAPEFRINLDRTEDRISFTFRHSVFSPNFPDFHQRLFSVDAFSFFSTRLVSFPRVHRVKRQLNETARSRLIGVKRNSRVFGVHNLLLDEQLTRALTWSHYQPASRVPRSNIRVLFPSVYL